MKLKSLVVYAAALALWYSVAPAPSKKAEEEKYNLPEQIMVVGAEYTDNSGIKKEIGDTKTEISNNGIETILNTNDINYSEHFNIKTQRYRIDNDEDWWISRQVGKVMSIPAKILFWDLDYGAGIGPEKSRSALAMLENDHNIKDITVRLNHNEVWYDLYRLFSDDKVTDNRSLPTRVLLGVPSVLLNEFWSELSRGSYYNPITMTAVNYSNINSINAHEIGHHRDFSKHDWIFGYTVARTLPPVMLWQEWQASINAKEEIMSKDDNSEFYRYLLPAFSTYVLFAAGAARKSINRFKKAHEDALQKVREEQMLNDLQRYLRNR